MAGDRTIDRRPRQAECSGKRLESHKVGGRGEHSRPGGRGACGERPTGTGMRVWSGGAHRRWWVTWMNRATGGYHCTRWSKTYSGCGCARASQSGTASRGASSRGWPACGGWTDSRASQAWSSPHGCRPVPPWTNLAAGRRQPLACPKCRPNGPWLRPPPAPGPVLVPAATGCSPSDPPPTSRPRSPA